MISIAINNDLIGELTVKNSDGQVVYRNQYFQYIDHLESNFLPPGLYLIHVTCSGRNFYEPLHIIDPTSELNIKIHSKMYW